MSEASYAVGDCVRSQRIGRRGVFDGEIVGVMQGHFIVRDDLGRNWLRLPDEMSPLKDSAKPQL